MPLTTDIVFPEADVLAIFRQIDRSSKELGRSLQQSVFFALKMITRSLAVSTKVVRDKERKVTQLSYGLGPRRGFEEFMVEGYRGPGVGGSGHPRKLQRWTVVAKSAENAKKYHGHIPNRGLAKRSWKKAAQAARISIATSGGGRTPRDRSRIDRLAARYGTFNGNLTSDVNPWFRIENELSYIRSALKGKGKKLPEQALERAASGMKKGIDRQIVRKLKAK